MIAFVSEIRFIYFGMTVHLFLFPVPECEIENTLVILLVILFTTYLIPKDDILGKEEMYAYSQLHLVLLNELFKPIDFTIGLIINTAEILLVVTMVNAALHNSISRLILI